jgi:putative transposase
MMYPLVRELAADGIPVTVTCRVLEFTPQAYYKWRADPVSTRDWSDAHLVDAAGDIHADDPAFGYRFIADELAAERGIRTSENRVQRLCSAPGIFSVLARKKGRWTRPGEPVHEDLVRRSFGAKAPNQLWFTDLTGHRTDAVKAVPVLREGRLLRAHRRLLHGCPDEGLARRGGPAQRDPAPSSLAGNAAMESFFALVQNNVLDLKRWHQGGASPGDRFLDRADLPPPAPPTGPG